MKHAGAHAEHWQILGDLGIVSQVLVRIEFILVFLFRCFLVEPELRVRRLQRLSRYSDAQLTL